MNVSEARRKARLKRKRRVRRKIKGTTARPRLCVFRSSKNIYAQLIDDEKGQTVLAISSLNEGVVESGANTGNVEAAKAVGQAIAKKAIDANIKDVVFDRNGFLYHGRVQALADAAREAGLSF